MLALAGCNGEIYLRDGVTDGDTFYLADRAFSDSDPVLQSWVTYSLSISACQLGSGSSNPARATSFECELTSRRLLVERWLEQEEATGPVTDRYLDELALVYDEGHLPGYVATHFGKRSWTIPPTADTAAFRAWAKRRIPGHQPETRLVGSWNYARKVRGL